MNAEATYDFYPGRLPLLVSVPHDGRELPPDVAEAMAPAGLAIGDTDWHVGRLYGFCRELGVSLIVARVSRYVVDLNRPADDAALYPGQLSTGLCPTHSFAGEPLYAGDAVVSEVHRRQRIASYWRPYHETLAAELGRMSDEHGVALLWDGHSIASRVPSLFEGELPDLNLGSYDGVACDPGISSAVFECASRSGYSAVQDGRFKGGYITRHYGRPSRGVHALQLELAQRCYMSEASLRYDPASADRLTDTLADMLRVFLERGLKLV